ncbi:hypothetical protein TNCV_405061 [Trichonephila clavipes]|nr:hypothetical protein TNCV_405061 [Trichonephila clavipes]
MTGEEKWIGYRYIKYRRTECRRSDSPSSNSNAELHLRKVLMSVWWDVQKIIYLEYDIATVGSIPRHLERAETVVRFCLTTRHDFLGVGCIGLTWLLTRFVFSAAMDGARLLHTMHYTR